MKVTSGNDICIDGGNCLSAVGTGSGDITEVNTNATTSGLSGGSTSGAVNLSVDVDDSSIEISGTNKVQIKDGGVTDAKIGAVGVQKITSGAGNFLTYAPSGTACSSGQVLELNGSGQWVCGNKTVNTDTTYTGGDGLTLTGTDFDVNVDGSSLEITGDTIQVKDGGVTDAKIGAVGVQKITSGAGNFLTYAPSGTACSSGQVLELNGSGQWVCGNKTVNTDTNDNLGNHEATQNIDLNTFKLVGNNGTSGIEIDAAGQVGIGGVPLASTALTVAGTMKVTSGNDICIDGGNCLSAVGTGSGDITEVNTNATTSGLSGGSTSGAVNLSVDVDDSSIEISGTNKVQIKDGGVTDAKIGAVGVQKITSGAGNFLTYAPSGTACSSGQVLELNGSGQWVCGNKTVNTDTNDNLGNHEATQNIDLNTFKLVGNNGTSGIEIDAAGQVGIGTNIPTGRLEIETANGDNVVPMVIDQNDITNNPIALDIQNAGSGDSLRINTNDFVVRGNGNVEMNSNADVFIGTTSSSKNTKLSIGSGFFTSNSSDIEKLFIRSNFSPSFSGTVNATANNVDLLFNPAPGGSNFNGKAIEASITINGTENVGSNSSMPVIQGRFEHKTQGLFQGNAFGVQGQVRSDNLAGNITGRSIGVEGEIYSAFGTLPTWSTAIGLNSSINLGGSATGGTEITNAIGVNVETSTGSGGTDIINNLIGIKVNAPSGNGTIANKYAFITEQGAGNVGIGTLTPDVALDVNTGVINASAICDENNANCIDLSAGVGGADNLGNHEATQNIDLNTFKLVGNNGTSGIEIDAAGQVGIGEGLLMPFPFPSERLHLYTSSGEINQRIESGDASVVATRYVNSASHWRTGIQSGDDYVIREVSPSTGNRLTIQSGGNVGIGTLTPQVALDVDTGIINASEICDENNANCIDLSAGVGGADNLGNHSATQNLNLGSNKLVGNGGTKGIYIDNSGRVGVNTTNTNSMFKVVQDGSIAPFEIQKSDLTSIMSVDWAGRIKMDTAISSTVPMLTVGDGNFGGRLLVLNGKSGFTGNLMEIKHNSVDQMVVTYDGNVGIGTSSPAVALDVNTGVINASEICDENNTNCIDLSAGVGGADNLGNHSATQNIYLNAFKLVGNNGSSGLEIDGSGKIGVGTSNPFYDLEVYRYDADSSLAAINGRSMAARYPKIVAQNYDESGFGGYPMFYGVNSRGNDGSPLPIQAGDILSSFLGAGSTDTSYTYKTAAGMRVVANENFGDSAHSGLLSFFTVNPGTTTSSEKMRISADGKVGIGTSNPSNKLSIVSTSAGSSPLSTLTPYDYVAKFESTDPGASIVLEDSTSTDSGNRIGVIGDDFRIITAGTERLRVLANGSVRIGGVGPAGANEGDLSLGGSTGIQGIFTLWGSTINSYSQIRTTDGNLHIDAGYGKNAVGNGLYLNWFNGGVTHVGNGSAGYGTISAANFNTVSDQSLKKNIKTLDNSLEKVLGLRGVEYYFNSDNFTRDKQIGFIAQEVELIFPEAVKHNGSYYTVSYSKLIAPLIEATKEQQSIIEENKRMFLAMQGQVEENTRAIASLKEENAGLKERVEKLESELGEIKSLLKKVLEARQ